MSSDNFFGVPETITDPSFTSVFEDRDFNTGEDIVRPIMSQKQTSTGAQAVPDLGEGDIFPGMSAQKSKSVEQKAETSHTEKQTENGSSDTRKDRKQQPTPKSSKTKEGKEKTIPNAPPLPKKHSKGDDKKETGSFFKSQDKKKKNPPHTAGTSLFPEDDESEGGERPKLTEGEILAKFNEKCKTIGLIPREQWRVGISKRYYANGSNMSDEEIDAIIFGMNLFRQYNSISETHEMLNSLFGELESIKVTSKELRDTNDNLHRAIDNNTNAIKRGLFEGMNRVMETIKKSPVTEAPEKKTPPPKKVNWNAPLKINVHSPKKEASVSSSDSEDETEESEDEGELARKEQTFLRKADIFLETVGVIPSDRKNPTMIVALRKCIPDNFIDKCLNEGLSKKEKKEAYGLLEHTVKKLIAKGKIYTIKPDPSREYEDESDEDAI